MPGSHRPRPSLVSPPGPRDRARIGRFLLVALASLACLIAVPATAMAAKEKGSDATKDRQLAEKTLEEAKDLFRGKGVKTGRELTLVLDELSLRVRALSGKDRAQAEGILARPTDGSADPYGDGYDPTAPLFYACSANFCFWYVATGDDAPDLSDGPDPGGVPDYVDFMADQFEFAYERENNQLGWLPPLPDNGIGAPDAGNANKLDVYIKNLTPQDLYGYVAPDPGQQNRSRYSFQVMDDDYIGYASTPNESLQATAGHEYNHVLQLRYNALTDRWHKESVATWMEEKVFPDVNDYLSYLGGWAQNSLQPLTESGDQGKFYGSAVWNHWLDRQVGEDVPRASFEWTASQGDIGTLAYDDSIRKRGKGDLVFQFNRFAASTAEWRASNSVYPDREQYPDVARLNDVPLRANDGGGAVIINHLGFGLIDVARTNLPQIRLRATLPSKLKGGIALVGRTGDELGGSAATAVKDYPRGGSKFVTLNNPGQFSRITAVIANSDATQRGFNEQANDWFWTKDRQRIVLEVLTPACDSAKQKYNKVSRALKKARSRFKKAKRQSSKRKYSRQVRSLKKKLSKAKKRRSRNC